MKIKVIEQGETEFTASTEWTEPDIRAALASDDKDGSVRSAIFDTTDTERDTDSDEYITITEDDGTVLWAGWLTGDKDRPAPDAGAAELAKAVELIRSLERLLTSWTRGMYAAQIDCFRGDPKAAAATLSEGLDGYDGPEWDGTETGAEWLERTKAEEGL